MKKKYFFIMLAAVFMVSFFSGYYSHRLSDYLYSKGRREFVLGNNGGNIDKSPEVNDGEQSDPYKEPDKDKKPRLPGGEEIDNKEEENHGGGKKDPPLNVDTSKLDRTEKSWYYLIRKNGEPSEEPDAIKALSKKYSAYYLGNTAKKNIYLTFDEGYENGYTAKILDVLKENKVKAAFFVTTPYIKENKELIMRMINEGHLVCNHSTTHPSMAALKDETAFNSELIKCEEAFKALTGKQMAKFFRPPMGKYSELSLYYTQKLGYKTIFWSFAYADWDTAKQPTQDYAKKLIMERTHGGGIYLLHAVSKTNTDILDWLLKEWKSKGYEFRSLNEL